MAKTFGKIAKRYARAIFELCQPAELELRRDALLQVSEAIASHAQLAQTLRNPAIPPAQREAVIRDLAALHRPGDQIFANFLATLLLNDRLDALRATIKIFSEMIEQFMRVLSLEVTSALALSEEQKRGVLDQIRGKLPPAYASLVTIQWHQDKNLIGGLVVKAGDKVLDGSLSGSLERVARTLG